MPEIKPSDSTYVLDLDPVGELEGQGGVLKQQICMSYSQNLLGYYRRFKRDTRSFDK